MKECIAKNDMKAVYVDGNKVKKVFSADYSKTDVLYEALNTSRVEDTGLDIPKLLGVSVEDGCWVITSERAEGPTLADLLAAHPENANDYVNSMVDYQIAFNKRTNPLLLKLKDKLHRQIDELDTINSSIKYELSTRLEGLPKHNKLCHGDYCLENIIVQTDENNQITSITAVDWVHATQGNASADVANTYLMLKLTNEAFAEKYISAFCEKTNTDRRYVNSWLPIVAAARLTKKKEAEKELLEAMVDVCDYQ